MSDDVLRSMARKIADLERELRWLKSNKGSITRADGWFPVSGAVYYSATRFDLPGDHTGTIVKGDKVWMLQPGNKYFSITKVAYAGGITSVTVTGGNDYSVANTDIVSVKISHAESPVGFPVWFSYTPTWACNTGTNPVLADGTILGNFAVKAGFYIATITLTAGPSTKFGSGSVYWFGVPIAMIRSDTMGYWRGNDPGVANYVGVSAYRAATFIDLPINGGGYVGPTAPWTWASGDSLRINHIGVF